MLRVINVIMAALVLGAAAGAAWLISHGVDSLRAQLTGTHGIIVATACEPFAKASTCTGEFTSDDGSMRVSDVTFYPPVKEWPMAPVEAMMSSRGARLAHTDDGWWIRFGGGLAFAIMAAYFFREFFWETEDRRTKHARLAIGAMAIVVAVSAWTLLT
jgi:hypothetical protein